ncbi:MAG TPA: insulinase family protein, partial [Gemmatimonadaceae bacterium]
YAEEQFVTSRMLLVVAGDIPRAQVEAAVQRTLATLPHGAYQWSLPEPIKVTKGGIIPVDRDVSTNYIVGMVGGPSRADPDYGAYERALGFLGGWVSYIVREQNALSYAAGVSVYERGASSGALYMSTTNPDSAIKLVNMILKELDEPDAMIPRGTMRKAQKSFDAQYVAESETAEGQATLLGRATLYDGDPGAAAKRAKTMSNVAFSDLKHSLRVYFKNIQYAYVGDTTRMPRKEMTKR